MINLLKTDQYDGKGAGAMEKTRRSTPLMFCHMAVMVLLMMVSIYLLFSIVSGIVAPQFREYYDTFGPYISIFAVWNFVNVLALICGIIYLRRGYTKAAANYYKAFILLLMLASVVLAVLNYINQGLGSGTIMMLIKIIILAVLAFGKDLGKAKTWLLFSVLVIIDIMFGIVSYMFPGSLEVTANDLTWIRSAVLFSRLIMDLTIAFAIRGKYADKDARGTI